MIVKLIWYVKCVCKSTIHGIFDLFIPQYKVSMQVIVIPHIQIILLQQEV